MIYKYRSTYEIIERLYRDGDYSDELPWEDCMIWIAEALDKIGAFPQYLRKVTGDLGEPCLDIIDYKAKLPCDVFRIEQVAVNGIAARYSGNSFHHLMGGDCCTVPVYPPLYEDLFKDNIDNIFTNLAAVTGNNIQVPTYDVNNNFLTLNMKEGKVCIAYIAKPIDKNGFPLIPDDIAYVEAVTKYCMYKLDYREWRKGKLQKDIFQYSEREWLFYCGQAKGSANMPSVDMLERIKTQWLKLIPETNQWKVFMK
jgi:hypothetical protein